MFTSLSTYSTNRPTIPLFIFRCEKCFFAEKVEIIVMKDYTKLTLEDLAILAKTAKHKRLLDSLFEEIVSRMETKIWNIVHRYNAKGSTPDDLYQEALIVLSEKAIPHYKPPHPFTSFALLIIRRRLINLIAHTKLKNRIVLDTSISLDFDHSTNNDGCSLVDIASSGGTVLDDLQCQEYYHLLFKRLFSVLTKFEREVFLLRAQNRKLAEILKKLNEGQQGKYNYKHVDNAMCNIKNKAKIVLKEHDIEYA